MGQRYAGIDIGSRTIELVVVNDAGDVLTSLRADTGFDPMLEAKTLLEGALYDKILATGVLVLLIAAEASSALLYYGVNNGNRRDWEGAFAMIEERAQEEDVVVSYWPKLVEYYLGEEGLEWQNVTPESVANSGSRHWFVIDSETIWANDQMAAWLEKNAELIDVNYLRTPEDISLRIYLYDPETQFSD